MLKRSSDIEDFKTLYMTGMPSDADLQYFEKIIGREIAEVLHSTPAINVYTRDMELIEDLIYLLQIADIRVLEVA